MKWRLRERVASLAIEPYTKVVPRTPLFVLRQRVKHSQEFLLTLLGSAVTSPATELRAANLLPRVVTDHCYTAIQVGGGLGENEHMYTYG